MTLQRCIIIVCLLGLAVLQAITNTALTQSQDKRAELQISLDSCTNSQQDLVTQLNRDDELISMMLGNWDREAAVSSRVVTVTAYTSRPQETDSTPWTTASNKKVRPGTIAVSRDLLPLLGGFGAEVVLAGYGSFTVLDVMNKRYENSVDIWAGDLKAAQLHGRRTATLIWQ